MASVKTDHTAVSFSPPRGFPTIFKSDLKETLFPDDPFKQFRNGNSLRRFVSAVRYFVPIFEWLPMYNLRLFRFDLLAGITITSLAIPQGISYAKLANVPPIIGLYSSFVPPLIYAIFGDSKHLAVGTVAACSLLLSSTIGEVVSPNENPALYLHLIFTATFITGIFQTALGFLRLGILVDFLSHSTITGFMGGTATIICLQQLKGVFGLKHFTTKTDVVHVIHAIISNRHEWKWESTVVGVIFLIFLQFTRYISQKKRKLFWVSAIAPMVVVLVGCVFAYLIRGKDYGIQIVGDLKKGINPSSIEKLTFDSKYLTAVIKAGIVTGLIALAEGIAIGRSFAIMKNEQVDGNKEMIAFGFMNIIGSFTSCYLTTGPFSKTAVNYNAGAKTAMSNIVMAVCMALTLLFLAPLFRYTPLVALSAIIMSAMLGLIKYEEAFHLFKVDKFDFVVCMAAFFGVAFISMDVGLMLSVGLSLLRALLYVARPAICKLGRIPNSSLYRDVEQYSNAIQEPGILVLQLGSPIYFASANYIRERVLRWLREEQERLNSKGDHVVEYIIIDLSGVSTIDVTGMETLIEVRRTLESRGIKPLRLDIKRKFAQRTERVKSVDLHPTEPWILASLYSGTVYIWNYQSQTTAKSFEVTDLPVRSAKFIARKQWVVAGADDMLIRVYDYNTMDKVKVFEAHTDYIRCVAVHPTLPYVLSSSDDMLIKLWDWEKGWMCTQIFEGHNHYVMQVTFNPKDTNTFASASLDHTVKIWNLGSPDPNFTLDAHLKGVNCVDYFTGGDKPYLISGSDDHTAKVWDYQTKSCVQTLEGHTHNVSAVCFHPEFPVIITGSEDGTLRIWHSTTYRLESTLNYGLERVWALGYMKRSRRIVIGYDEGCIMVKIGREEPIASMDNSGKIIWAKHNEIQTVNIKSVGIDEVTDGERLSLAVKELGTCDIYPQSLKHNPSGRFVVVCGDGEYIIYTALAWRNRSFGSCLEFVWSSDGEYAVRESTSRIKIFSKTFQEKKNIRPTFSAEHIYGGTLLAMCSSDFICFYDWAECRLIRRIDVNVKNVYWADSGDLVAITSDSSFYILKYNRDVVSSYFDSGRPVDELGVEDAFELLYEINERVRTGLWVGTVSSIITLLGDLIIVLVVTTMFHLDRPMYLLGYLANQSRVYLIDKDFNVVGYSLLLTLIEYKTLVMRGDLERASQVLPTIPPQHHNSVARFLESRNMLEEALAVATDPDYRFDLAIQLGKLETAREIAIGAQSESKWKQLGALALSRGKLEMAEDCLSHGKDFSGLLLLYSSLGDAQGIQELASLAKEQGKNNIAFLCLFMLGKLEECIQLLLESNRIPEAALMARSYLPSKVSEIISIWRNDLDKANKKAGESLADPEEYPNMFDDWQVSLSLESEAAKNRCIYPPAEHYPIYAEESSTNLLERFRSMQINGEEDLTENGELDDEKTVENGGNQGQNDIADEDADSANLILINNDEHEEECCTKDENISSP
ncbi:hypothetical protein FNV43_RR15851 [Rhamnella rubrinervis]|uniref:STAS domain-containing protein n=1 Tax=Rhamnella rubrinervis TaxID=2594499 RepID=A0A8K0E2I1_9ROSA|nr:hypothetical protein FNV43_RR15851 [Rhamnella rubrinervis]